MPKQIHQRNLFIKQNQLQLSSFTNSTKVDEKVTLDGSDVFYTERAERSLQAPLQKCCKKQQPLKNAAKYLPQWFLTREGSTKSFQGFGGRWILPS